MSDESEFDKWLKQYCADLKVDKSCTLFLRDITVDGEGKMITVERVAMAARDWILEKAREKSFGFDFTYDRCEKILMLENLEELLK